MLKSKNISKMAEIKPNEVYTSSETEKLLKVSNSTLKRLIKNGLIKAGKIGGQYRFLGHDLLQMFSTDLDQKVTQAYKKARHATWEKTRDW
jgi:excisionase family DNA binding protein